MSYITVTQKGSFDKTEKFLTKIQTNKNLRPILEKYGERGVSALQSATPVDSGMTAESWSYDIVERPGYISVRWYNSNREYGAPVAILLQYGHGTRNGGFVQGRDYIMPAIQPIFDQILAEAMKEVTA